MANDSVFSSSILSPQTRRRLKSLLINPELQIRLPVYLLIVTLIFACASWIVLHVAFNGLYDFAFEQGNIGEQVGDVLRHHIRIVVTVLTLLIIMYVLLTIGLSVAYLHKLIGPSIAFKRHISTLKDGNYSSRILLRQDDALGEMAIELNELAEALEKKHHPAEPESI